MDVRTGSDRSCSRAPLQGVRHGVHLLVLEPTDERLVVAAGGSNQLASLVADSCHALLESHAVGLNGSLVEDCIERFRLGMVDERIRTSSAWFQEVSGHAIAVAVCQIGRASCRERGEISAGAG